jgi:hypothetical protein
MRNCIQGKQRNLLTVLRETGKEWITARDLAAAVSPLRGVNTYFPRRGNRRLFVSGRTPLRY